MGPTSSSPGPLLGHLTIPLLPRPVLPSTPSIPGTLKPSPEQASAGPKPSLRRHTVLGMKSKLLDRRACPSLPPPPPPLNHSGRSPCSHRRSRPGACTAGPPASCALQGFPLQVGFHPPGHFYPQVGVGHQSSAGNCRLCRRITERGRGRQQARGQGRAGTRHRALLNLPPGPSLHVRCPPSGLSSGLSPPAGHSLRRGVSHAAPAPSVHLLSALETRKRLS